MCGKEIAGNPLMHFDLPFDSRMCVETYRKLVGAFGASLTETGLPLEVLDVSFFFTDIVGLSDPSLSVEKQIRKIVILNRLISVCNAFKKTPTYEKKILPTGDGMAIGFLLRPELPLELAMQLHRELQQYNRDRSPEDTINVRIGLASGPVFVVPDMNGNQNVWGPGIILARRVMDIGNSGHILLVDKLAEELIALKDEYRRIIRPMHDTYRIKHGQTIKVYSAFSDDFGNPTMPTSLAYSH
jgi:hypothetical protein